MKKDRRIGIVGAGAAGLSAAHYLKQQGYRNITLFEAAERVGGKCCSIELDGAVFDIGAIIVTMGYSRVLTLAAEYNVPLIRGPRLVYQSIETGERRKLFTAKYEGATTLKSLLRCARLMMKTRPTRAPGHTHLDFGLDKDISSWFHENQLRNIQEVVVPAFTGFGYGYQEFIPMAYLLKGGEIIFATNSKWFRNVWRCSHEDTFGDRTFRLADLTEPLMFERGYQSLFEAIASNFDVRLNTAATAIQANGDVRTLRDNHDQSHQFDSIIVATPPQETANLMRFNSSVNALFQLPKTLNYHVFLAEFKKPVAREGYFLAENTMSNAKLGRPVVVGRASPASNIGPCYVYGDETTNDTDLENNLEEDCDRLGMGLKCIRTHQRWDHFPHLDPEHFNQFYRQLERAQGNQGIYFAGEVANFSTVEHVVRYSNALVERYF